MSVVVVVVVDECISSTDLKLRLNFQRVSLLLVLTGHGTSSNVQSCRQNHTPKNLSRCKDEASGDHDSGH